MLWVQWSTLTLISDWLVAKELWLRKQTSSSGCTLGLGSFTAIIPCQPVNNYNFFCYRNHVSKSGCCVYMYCLDPPSAVCQGDGFEQVKSCMSVSVLCQESQSYACKYFVAALNFWVCYCVYYIPYTVATHFCRTTFWMNNSGSHGHSLVKWSVLCTLSCERTSPFL